MRSAFQFATRGVLVLAVLSTGAGSMAQVLTRTQSEFFENKVRPIFVNDCYKCHSKEAPKLKGGLSLESREGWLTGGNSGPAIVPGNPDASLLIKAIRYTNEDLQMPPKGRRLSDSEIADLETWVKMGAPDPRVAIVTSAGKNSKMSPRDHWAFQPIKNPPVPEAKATRWIQTPVDNFILAKLEENGMEPNRIADKWTLIRRATFDLIGLPPSTQEVKDFVDDNSPDAFAKVIDRLLQSPHYGERWGRFWLDTARYSDTKGEVRKNQEDYRYRMRGLIGIM